jgi:YidC/Oxa1 family membrane protein insertase
MTILTSFIQEILFSIHSVLPNWGVAIILFSFAFRLLIFPLQFIAAKETKKLRKIQPNLKLLLEKHRDSPQTYFSETGKIKKQAGVKSWIPVLLMVVQMPVFISIYASIRGIAELHGASFLWVQNLSAADPHFFLPLIMFALVYWQQKTLAEKSPAPIWLMPSVSFVFMTALPSALVLHSLTSMLFQVGGERVINRLI